MWQRCLVGCVTGTQLTHSFAWEYQFSLFPIYLQIFLIWGWCNCPWNNITDAPAERASVVKPIFEATPACVRLHHRRSHAMEKSHCAMNQFLFCSVSLVCCCVGTASGFLYTWQEGVTMSVYVYMNVCDTGCHIIINDLSTKYKTPTAAPRGFLKLYK